jgi:hypothetical protein
MFLWNVRWYILNVHTALQPRRPTSKIRNVDRNTPIQYAAWESEVLMGGSAKIAYFLKSGLDRNKMGPFCATIKCPWSELCILASGGYENDHEAWMNSPRPWNPPDYIVRPVTWQLFFPSDCHCIISPRLPTIMSQILSRGDSVGGGGRQSCIKFLRPDPVSLCAGPDIPIRAPRNTVWPGCSATRSPSIKCVL